MAKKSIIGSLKELYDSKYILEQLVRQQLILRYRRTVFGYLWTLFNPLLMLSVTATVFSTLFQLELKTYMVFLFAGMIPFMYFSSAVTQSGMSLILNEGLIKMIYIPKALFPLSITISLIIDSMLTSFVLLLLMLLVGAKISVSLLFLPVAFMLIFLFTYGVALIMSVMTVYFRDLQYVVGIAMQALLFLTPIFYKPESLKGNVASLINLNPLTQYVMLFRRPIYDGVLPDLQVILLGCLLSALSFFIGTWFFRRREHLIAFRL